MQKIDPTKKYTLAVSGGADSMAMLQMFFEHIPKLNFDVVTINHNLRAESEKECRLVCDFCKKLGIDCQIFQIDTKTYAKTQKMSIETAARTLRYQIFEKLPSDFVCLAHNSTDNAETVLLHIIRGSGLKGACGILPSWGKYLRPVLNFSKDQLTEYCKAKNVPYAVDQSNFDTKYSRNFLRQKIFPLLKQLNQNVEQNLNRFAQNAIEDENFLENLADISKVSIYSEKKEEKAEKAQKSCQNSKNDDEIQKNPQILAEIPINLLHQPKPIAVRLLKKVFLALNITSDIEKVHFDAIIDLSKNFGGKNLSLPFDLTATNEYNKITIIRTPVTTRSGATTTTTSETPAPAPVIARSGAAPVIARSEATRQSIAQNIPFNISHLPTDENPIIFDTSMGKITVQVEKTPLVSLKFNIPPKNSQKTAQNCPKTQNNTAIEQNRPLFFDIEKIPADAVIRTKKTGDTFTKFGGGTKPLTKYLIDKKIPLRIRQNLPLICQKNQVLAILGIEIADNLKITNDTKLVAKIQLNTTDFTTQKEKK